MERDGEDRPERITGLPTEEAVEVVLDGDTDEDRDGVRAVLETVAADGVVTEEALQERLGGVSKVVSTPETRVELAAMALSEARESAADVTDLDAVRARLDAFEERRGRLEGGVADLGVELQRLVERSGEAGAVYGVARDLRRLEAEADRLQGAADELAEDVEEFERWVDDPDVRFDELAADLDIVEESLEDLAGELAALEEVQDGRDASPEGDDGGEGESESADVDPGVAWADAAFRHRVLDLLLEDARAELADLRAWRRREDGGDDRARALEERLRSLETRQDALGNRVAAVARSEWIERFGERLSAFESALQTAEPPVDWGSVQATLEEHRSRFRGE